ncbi:MAG: amidase family protein [Acidimicrobiales bacterium]
MGPLHGLPMTIKDVWETEGLVTTAGAPELRHHVPGTDALTVARLKAAGAIVFGKTNVPLYAGDFQTYNDVYGRTNNPWDTARTAGGSSGGAATSLALPTGPTPGGLPVGVQVVGPYRGDLRLLRLAELVDEAAGPGFTPPPV